MVTPSLRGHPGKPPGPALGFFSSAFPSPQQLPEVVLKKTGWLGRGPSGSAVRGPKMWPLHPPKSCREPHPGLLSQMRVQGPSQGSPGPGFAEGWPEQLGVRGRMGGSEGEWGGQGLVATEMLFMTVLKRPGGLEEQPPLLMPCGKAGWGGGHLSPRAPSASCS